MHLRSHCSSSLLPLDTDLERNLRRRKRKGKEQSQEVEMDENGIPIPPEGGPEQVAGNNGHEQNSGVRHPEAEMRPIRSIMDYGAPTHEGMPSSIRRPVIDARNYEIKASTITMLENEPFYGLPRENPNEHLTTFLDRCALSRQNGVSEDAVKLILFPFSLKDKAKAWFRTLPEGSITTWDELATLFVQKFFPPSKTLNLKNAIHGFRQDETETMMEAWERLQDLLRSCPHHGVQKWELLQTFYHGLHAHDQGMLNASAGGCFMRMAPDEAYEMISHMASTNGQWGSERGSRRGVVNSIDVAAIAKLSSQLEAMDKKIERMSSPPRHEPPRQSYYEPQGQRMDNPPPYTHEGQNQEEVYYANNRRPYDPNTNAYHPDQRQHHPNFKWDPQEQVTSTGGQARGHGNQGYYGANNHVQGGGYNHQLQRQAQPPYPNYPPQGAYQYPNNPYPPQQVPPQHMSQPPPEKKTSLEEMMVQFLKQQIDRDKQQADREKLQRERDMRRDAEIDDLRRTINQMASRNERIPGTLPSNTERNPREKCKVITLRSGNVYEKPKVVSKPNVTQEVEKETTQDDEEEVPKESVDLGLSQEDKGEEDQANPSADKEKFKEKEGVELAKGKKVREPVEETNRWAPPPPYPYAIKKRQLDANFSKFLEVFKKLKLNIPFLDAIREMPSYAKHLKDLFSKKRKWEKYETIHLHENCSAILLNKLPPKQGDPSSFTIPWQIGSLTFAKSLCDLGASINLMPLSVFRKLGLGDEPPPTTVSLQLADRSVTYPRGLIEDLLVKVGKFVFPADFIVLDMEEDQRIPLLLGRPFLRTVRSLIDVELGQLTVRCGDESMTFEVFKSSNHNASCFRIDHVDARSDDDAREIPSVDHDEMPQDKQELEDPGPVLGLPSEERSLEANENVKVNKQAEGLSMFENNPSLPLNFPDCLNIDCELVGCKCLLLALDKFGDEYYHLPYEDRENEKFNCHMPLLIPSSTFLGEKASDIILDSLGQGKVFPRALDEP